MTVEVRTEAFDPWREVQRHEQSLGPRRTKLGACVTFVGSMRDFNEGAAVQGMTLEHYPGMTERHLERICGQASAQWRLDESLVIHRVGDVAPGDAIVLVAVWSAHRRDAFEACRFIMEDLKAKAPFWKRERLDQGTRWVEKNTPGY